jgi:hypothetical protein
MGASDLVWAREQRTFRRHDRACFRLRPPLGGAWSGRRLPPSSYDGGSSTQCRVRTYRVPALSYSAPLSAEMAC